MSHYQWKKAHNEYRAWTNDLSGWEYLPLKQCSCCEVQATPEPEFRKKSVVVEAMVPSGPMVKYGALGLTFEQAQDSVLRVEVCLGSEGIKAGSTIAMESEIVTIGMTYEFCDAVLETLKELLNGHSELPAGKLSVSAAGIGIYGTSIHFMKRLTKVAFRLLLAGEQGEVQVKRIVEDEVTPHWREYTQ